MHTESESSDAESSGDEYHLHKLGERSSDPIEVQVMANGKEMTMELDTGAAVSIISDCTRKALFPHQKVHKSSLILKTYTEEPMKVLGNLHVRVQYESQEAKLVLVVVEGNGPSLFGRNWLKYLRLNWSNIAVVRSTKLKLHTLLHLHESLFKDELGTIEPYQATLHVQTEAAPRFFKPRPVPFAIKDAIGQELDRLEKQGIIEKVTHSEWAAPIIAVPKRDRKFHICGDYKVTINPVLSVDQYPLPKPEDLFATLANGTVFT